MPGLRGMSSRDNAARPHTWIGDQIVEIPYVDFDSLAPAGSISSCALEMAQWLILQLGEGTFQGTQLLDRDLLLELRTPHTPIPLDPATRQLNPTQHFSAYGLGWFLSDYQGRLLVSHGGHVDGMFSRSGFLPEENVGAVVLTNDERNELKNAVLLRALDAMLDLPERDWGAAYLESFRATEARNAASRANFGAMRVTGTHLSLPQERYLGVYTHPVCGDATLTLKEGHLRLQLSDHSDIGGDCEHWHYDTLACRWDKNAFGVSLVPFILDGQGHVEGFRLKIREDWIDSMEYVFSRYP
jgi:hypothetical protein